MQMQNDFPERRGRKIHDWRYIGIAHGAGFHLVVHLLGAVEDVHHNAERTAQVFGGLGFPRACRTSWGSAHGQVEGLGQCDVASVMITHKHIHKKQQSEIPMIRGNISMPLLVYFN